MHVLPECDAARRASRSNEGYLWAGGRSRPSRAWSPAVRAGVAFVLSLGVLSGCALPESFRQPWDASTDEGRQHAEGKAQSDAARKRHRALVQRTQRLLNDLGYKAIVAYGWEDAAALIADYLNINEINPLGE